MRVPLHPEVLSEAAASLLPDAVRPAFVWDLRLDGAGALTSAEVHRAMVRSVERLDYATVQAAVDAGTDDERFLAAPRDRAAPHRAGAARAAGASLPMPEQQVTAREGGGFTLEFRPPVPAEEWNAQVSLLTGMAAADDDARRRPRRAAHDAGTRPPMPWRGSAERRAASVSSGRRACPYGDLVRGLDRTNPRHLALIHEATSLFRGAGYTAFDGDGPASSTSTARSPLPTPTSRRPCAAWSTGSASSCARR